MATDPLNDLELREGHEKHGPKPFALNGSTYLIPQCPVMPSTDEERALCDAVDAYEGAASAKESRETCAAIIEAALSMMYKEAYVTAVTRPQFVAAYVYIVTGAMSGE